ncbi:MAG: GNAT family N-acetyltransferase [Anaerolineales bacterium]|nr:GNAT family N-acetyltransferase [Anaerolineales bacterium]
MMNILIRPYVERDRSTVRRIANATSDRGEQNQPIFSNADLLADVLTRYYTDFEPQSLWVAECSGSVVGYLSGCMDPGRYKMIVFFRMVPAAIFHTISSGALWHRETWRLVGALMRTLSQGDYARDVSEEEYPAHLHINILGDFRGQQIGKKLMERFLLQAQIAGVHGVHAGVRENNVSAIRFFEHMGFLEVGTQAFFLPSSDGYRVRKTVIYGKRL